MFGSRGKPMEREPQRDRVYSVEHVAQLLKIERKSAYVAIQRGEIPSIRIGRRILIPVVAFNRLLDEGQKL
jgi:excisionase family DNA binding protein